MNASESRPIIGLTTYLEQAQTGVWDVPAAFLPHTYFDAVTRAGGIAVLLPPQPVSAAIADQVLDRLDGLIVTGGKDIDPARYGQAAHAATDESRPDRDSWEHELLLRAIDRRLPFLGICRGAQMLNVTLGGTLHQHLPDVIGDTTHQAGNGVFNQVAITVEPSSRLHELLDRSVGGLRVPVYHHQSVDRVADGLVVTARSSGSGIVQAVELTSVPFGIAVQWHPEQNTDDIRLFSGLVAAATHYANTLKNRDEHE
ncbi:gamma-glutamyl-gamma-aminobutyrate hydrolase family protein [Cryobacterium sp. CG_9.6]|uniref:gamma-glutamyl-gamma-aminobutyrate hydrolase family protein n=1 Tax=Cryobacterium sp. CG_9.6 TaxID=2760710 RepID=UPI002475673A|nr:gamma-glutamyl-gamma-aminobutyrate hydrolase family protein [Cryobacterium sp. CG_9.6]MDH6236536.1 putative glutamine amidotransferase [Cryobacterium sp. CG_9.6]